MNRLIRILIITFIFFISGCAQKILQVPDGVPAPRKAQLFYQMLGQHLKMERKRNALGARVRGFPYLRTSRLLTYLKENTVTQQQHADWINHLKTLDLSARYSEIKTLSKKAVEQMVMSLDMAEITNRDDLLTYLLVFSDRLLAYDKKDPNFHDILKETVASPEDYSAALRVFGAYPLAFGPILYFTKKSYNRMEQWHQQPFPPHGEKAPVTAYQPKENRSTLNMEIETIFASTETDSLGLFHFGPDDQKKLAAHYAPVYQQVTSGTVDRPGMLVWQEGKVVVDTDRPAVYYYFSHAVMGGIPVFQINYVIWYPERKGPEVPWYEQGHLDGFNFRVTVDRSGMPLMVDVVHNCGCYHFFAPKENTVKSVKPFALQIGNPAPAQLPDAFPTTKIALGVSPGWHQVRSVGPAAPFKETRTYELIPYARLESLEKSFDQNESIFNETGIAKGTGRIEPLFLFPAGIPDIGAMRQRTHQPTRLIGREHFDNPLLFDNHFELVPAVMAPGARAKGRF